jgi:hypothetical protein
MLYVKLTTQRGALEPLPPPPSNSWWFMVEAEAGAVYFKYVVLGRLTTLRWRVSHTQAGVAQTVLVSY